MSRLSEAVAACLSKVTDTVFTIPAESILDILKASINRGLRVISAKFEPSAGFMALVYSRVTLKPGVLIVTAGPGIIGSLLAVGQALIEGDPMIIVATAIEGERGTGMHQFPNRDVQLSALKPLTKASFKLSNANDVADVFSKAYELSMSGKPGPVYVEIPLELMDAEVGVKETTYAVSKPSASDEDVELVADLIAEASHPAILVGRGVVLSGAKDLAIKCAEILSAPIATSIMAKGAVPPDHPLYAGVAAGRCGNAVAHEVLRNADVVLAIGNRFSEMGTCRYSLELRGKLVHVNVDSSDLGRSYKPYVSLLSDAKDFLVKLLSKLTKRRIKDKGDVVGELRELWRRESEELEALQRSAEGPIKPWEVIKAIREVFKKRTIFLGDIGAHRIESFLMPVYYDEMYITSTSYVSMGIAVPGSVAASLACPDRDVVAIVGDGGFMMTGLEVATAVQYNAKPRIVVFNDSLYKVLGIYEKVRTKSVTMDLVKMPFVDVASLAKSMGAEGLLVSEREDLKDALVEASRMEKPVVVDVRIDPRAIPIPFQRLYKIREL